MKRLNNEKGFTLIEVLMAMVIFSIGIITLITMQTAALKGNTKAHGITKSATWAQDRVEKLVFTDFDDIETGNTTSPDGHYQINWTVDDTVMSSVPYKPLKQISITLTRTDFGSQRDVVFNYYRQIDL